MLKHVKSQKKLTSGSFTPCKITCFLGFWALPRCLLKAIGFQREWIQDDPGVRQGGDEDQQRGPGAEEVETLVAPKSCRRIWKSIEMSIHMIWKSRNVMKCLSILNPFLGGPGLPLVLDGFGSWLAVRHRPFWKGWNQPSIRRSWSLCESDQETGGPAKSGQGKFLPPWTSHQLTVAWWFEY